MSEERWNLLQNPSWDSATLDGWQLYNQSGTVSTAFSNTRVPGPRWGYLAANYSLEVYLGAGASVSIGNINFIPVSLEDDYQVVVYTNGGNSYTKLRLMVKYYTAGLIHHETQYNEYTGPWTSWTILRGVSVPPPTAAFARYAVRLVNTGTSTTYVYLDETAMYRIKSPLLRGFWTWNNSDARYNMTTSKNMIRIYALIAQNRGSSGTHIYIEPADDVPAAMLAGITVGGNSTVGNTYNPAVYGFERPYSTIPWRIRSMASTGGLVVAVAYFNTMDYWTTDDV